MMNTRNLLVCGMLLLTGCHGDTSSTPVVDTTPHVKRQPAVKRGPTPDELTAGMVEAVTMGKSTVPVAVKFDLPVKPTAGQAAEITLVVMPQIEADRAILTVTGSDTLVLAPGGQPVEIPSVEPTQVYRHNVQLTPTSEGVQLLGLSVSLKHDEITETREFSVPIIVAAGDIVPAAARHAGSK